MLVEVPWRSDELVKLLTVPAGSQTMKQCLSSHVEPFSGTWADSDVVAPAASARLARIFTVHIGGADQ